MTQVEPPDAPGMVLLNANVLALDGSGSRLATLVIRGDRIAWVGDGEPPPGTPAPGSRRIDCAGATVLPGFIDPHCHPLALGSALAAVNCEPAVATDIPQIQVALARAAAERPGGGWIVARGYDELRLAERRHPTRRELDTAVPDRPVRLQHGSGHAVVLNSRALELVGVDAGTVPPAGGVIERDPATGEPTGLLIELADWLRGRLPRPGPAALRDYARRASEALLAAGITSVTDAGPGNDSSRMDLYRRLHATGDFVPRTTVMLRPDVRPGTCPPPGPVRPGAAKIVLSYATGSLQPDFDCLVESLRTVHARGQPAALHAVEADAVLMACEALGHLAPAREVRAARHRIEHASECPPHVARAVAASGAAVVTQPGFIRSRGDRYLAAEAERAAPPGWLYAVRTLREAGVPVAGSSDAPAGPVEPLTAVGAAVTRRSASGRAVGPCQAASVEEALRLYGPGAAWIERREAELGTLAPGMLADLAVLAGDPTATQPDRIASIPVRATVIGGRIVGGSL